MQIEKYWTLPPADQTTIRTQIEQEEAAEEAERKRVVGYLITIEGEDSTMEPRQPDRDVIVCAGCYGEPRYRPDGNKWEHVTKEEYTDKEFILYKAKCQECKKPLA
jgi:hypothetical protein